MNDASRVGVRVFLMHPSSIIIHLPVRSHHDDRPSPRSAEHLLAEVARAGRRPAPAGSDLPPAVPQGLHLPRRRRRSCPTSATWASATSTPRPTCKARPGSKHGYDITNHQPLNPEIGTRRGLRGAGRRPARARPGPDPRHRAQPHGHRRQREPLVERRAGERPRVALRRLLRHRLAVVAAAGAAQPRPAADPRRPLRQGAGIGAAPPGLRGRRLHDPLFRPSLSRRARAL